MTSSYASHLSFPFRIAQDGRTEQVRSLEEHVRDELIQLLLTGLGERAFLTEFGGGVRQLVFEPVGESTLGITKARITQAISTWLGHRITLEDLQVTLEEATLNVEIQYRVGGKGDSRVLRLQHDRNTI